MKNKIISLFLATTLIFTMSACGSTKETSNNTASSDATASGTSSTTAEVADPYGAMKETVTIHIGRSEDPNVSYLAGEDSSNNYVTNYIKEQLNVDYVFDFSVNTDSYETKVNMAIASGEMPDVMFVTEAQLRELVQADAIEDLTSYYDTYASDSLKAAYDTTNGISFKAATYEDKLMAMPSISPGADGVPLLFVRGDWMEEQGLQEPKTLDDIVNIIKTFQDAYDLEEGLVVSQKIASKSGNNTYGLDALFALYGCYPKHWVTDADGNLVYGSNMPETKEALTAIKGLLDDGIISPSFIVRDADQCAELVTSGQAGVFFGAWWNMSWPLNNMIQEDDSIYWNCYAAPLTSDGIYNTAMISPSSNFLVVKKGASAELMEAVIKTMNYQFDIDQDQAISLKKDPSDPYSWSEMPFTLLLSTYNDKEGKAQAVMDAMEGKLAEADLVGEQAIWYSSYKEVAESGFAQANANNNISGWAYTRGAYPLSANESSINKVFDASYSHTETMDSKWATLEKLEDEAFLEILSGNAPIDRFDEYVSSWNSLGGDTIKAELEALITK